VNLFLAQLAAMLEPDVQAVLVWDGAGFHRANDLICPSNITLVSLPPYSPELNPFESLWHYLRSQHSPNCMYGTVDNLFDAAETAWLDPAIIRTVCHAPYHAVKCWGLVKVDVSPVNSAQQCSGLLTLNSQGTACSLRLGLIDAKNLEYRNDGPASSLSLRLARTSNSACTDISPLGMRCTVATQLSFTRVARP
jgi:hypothetical protein